MADLAGSLQIRLKRVDGRLCAEILSSRPVSASRAFVGKEVAETATGLPALFSVCATAQAVACARACERALGVTAPREVERVREILVNAETVREHLWRILLDWPGFLGAEPDGPTMGRVMRAFSRLRAGLSGGSDPLSPGTRAPATDQGSAGAALDELVAVGAAHVLGCPPDDWLERVSTAEGVPGWAHAADSVAARLLRQVEARGWGGIGRSAVKALPPLADADLDSRLGAPEADAFVSAPVWAGAPAESSPFTRTCAHPVVTGLLDEHGNGLLPRIAGQLTELASLLSGLLAAVPAIGAPHAREPVRGAGALPEGVGVAQVQAARGLLVHRVRLRDRQVADYRILAPTEWNFHARGPVAEGLSGFPTMDDETLRRLAGLFVTAVDPCVGYSLSIS